MDGFVLFVHSNITIIHEIYNMEDSTLKKKLKKASSKKKKVITRLFALRF